MITRVVVALVVSGLSSVASHAQSRVFREDVINKVSGIYQTSFILYPGATYDFWTSDLVKQSNCTGANADSVLHLRELSPTEGPLATNDDCALSGLPNGLNSCIRYTNSSASYKIVKLYAHAYSTCNDATGSSTRWARASAAIRRRQLASAARRSRRTWTA